MVEDVAATGGSALKAVEAVEEGAEVALVLTMVDREEGRDGGVEQAGLTFRSLLQGGGVFVKLDPNCSSAMRLG